MTRMLAVDPRFCGPEGSANGGYTCGLLARGIPGPVEVTLRKPPPLGRVMRVEPGEPVRLLDGDAVVAEAKPAAIELEVAPPPSFEEALARGSAYAGLADHRFPVCFVCGTRRDDGLGLRPGPLGDGRVAAAWIPDATLGGADGVVPTEILWAALDCPGYWSHAGHPMALLGRMTAEAEPGVRVGDRCVITGWSRGREGRKLHAATALFDAHGRLWGRSLQTWIVLSES